MRENNHRPEADLVIWACSLRPEAERQAAIQPLLEAGLDWHLLVSIAAANRVLPLLCSGLQESESGAVPAEVMAWLETNYHETTVRNLGMLEELGEILAELDARGISCIPYKGPALLPLYEKIGLRQFRDLDILVPRKDVDTVRSLLLERGYRPRNAPKKEARLLRGDCEIHLDHDEKDIPLELHWHILPPRHARGFRTSSLWQASKVSSLAGRQVLTLPPEELLMVLCIHGGEKHAWSRLQMISDVARVVRRQPELDWDELFRQAAACKRTQTVQLGLYLAKVLLGAPLPEPVCEELRKLPLVEALAALIRGRLARVDIGLPGLREWRRHLASAAAILPPIGHRHRPRLRYYRAVTTPEWADRKPPFPPFMSFLSYLYRPLRLFCRHRVALVGRMR